MRILLEPIWSGRTTNYQAYRKGMKDLLETEADQINKLLEKPKSRVNLRKTGIKTIAYDWEIHAGALHPTKGNQVLSWINYGTGPRDITAVSPKGPMVFQVGYSPQTSPGKLARGVAKSSGPKVTTRLVKNHRIDPRRFDKAVVKRRKGYFERKAKNRFSEAARRHWS